MEALDISSGERLFSVEMEGQIVATDIDILTAGGGSKVALVRSGGVTVADGQLNLDFAGIQREALVSAITFAPLAS